MKFSKLSQLFLVSMIGLLVATLLSACQLITIDYIYVAGDYGSTSGNAGAIQIFAVDSESGALRFVDNTQTKPTATGGNTPVAMATTSDYANLYVANSDNDTVVHFTIAGDGSLAQKDTITLAATCLALS